MKDIVLKSGGAKGADCTWDTVASQYGIENRRHFWYGNKTPIGNVELTKEELEEGWIEVQLANIILKRGGFNKYKNLLSRNWFQVKGSQQILAIGYLDKGVAQGGTAWALAMGILNEIPSFIFNQMDGVWYQHIVNDDRYSFNFVKVDVPLMKNEFAGIGSRKLLECGERAIRDVFEKRFGKR